MKKELLNYIFNHLFSKNVLKVFSFSTKLLIKLVIDKSGFKNIFFYPAFVKKKIKLINSSKVIENNKIKENEFKFYSINKIKLATSYLKYKNFPDWNKKFFEHEEYVSLHRWNWLLLASSEYRGIIDYNWGVQMVRSYLDNQGSLPTGVRSESYTISERISNFILFTHSQGKSLKSIPLDILTALKEMSYELTKKIEYFSMFNTGNHTINNARAFILIGVTIDDQNFKNLGFEILKDMIPKLIDRDGFLTDGSSHYQFLITRWLLEIRMITDDNNDKQIVTFLLPYIVKMLQACNFFIVKDNNGKQNIPLFGDISPDCSIDWMIDIPRSSLFKLNEKHDYMQKLKGWSLLFNNWRPNTFIEIEKLENKNFYEFDEWKRFTNDEWTLFLHTEDASRGSGGSHSHVDFTSFVLYHKGRELIIDIGRYNYSNNFSYGVNAKDHSLICLNNLSPALRRKDKFFTKKYKKNDITINHNYYKEKFELSLQHSGFSRIRRKNILHERKWILKNKLLTIKDNLNGTGSYDLQYFFQIPFIKKLFFSEKEFRVILENDLNFHLSAKINDTEISLEKPVNTKRSKFYGHEINSSVISGKIKISLPCHLEFNFAMKEKEF